MTSTRKKRVHVPPYVNLNQLVLEGFESPFEQNLNPRNRWIVLVHLIPWDEICNLYFKCFPKGKTGLPPLNSRIVIDSLILKQICDLDNRETVLTYEIHCTRVNRVALKELGIKLIAMPLGRPSILSIHVSPGERNPIEGTFGQTKTGYVLSRIKARLKETRESWILTIVLVLNLVKLAGVALLRAILDKCLSFSARLLKTMSLNLSNIFKQTFLFEHTDDARHVLYGNAC